MMDPATQAIVAGGVIGVIMFLLNWWKKTWDDARAERAEQNAIAREKRNLEALRNVKDATDQQTQIVQKIGQTQVVIATVAAREVAKVAAAAVVTAQVLAANTADNTTKVDDLTTGQNVIHGLVNSAFLDQLRQTSGAKRVLANRTREEADVVAADLAERVYREHAERDSMRPAAPSA